MHKENPQNARLHETQRWLRWVITEPRGVALALSDPTGAEPSPQLLASIVDAPPLAREARLDIYAEAYFSRLSGTLAIDFETVAHVLGEDLFQRLIAEYLVKYPSRSANIGDVGSFLPGFIKTHRYNSDHPYLADLAALEWSLIKTFYAQDVTPLDTTKLTAFSEEDWAAAQLILDPSVQFMTSTWPVDELWHNRSIEEKFPARIESAERRILVYRQDYILRVENIAPLPWGILQDIAAGKTLGAIMQNISEISSTDDSAAHDQFQNWFQDWVMRGIIRDVRVVEGTYFG